MCATLNRTKTKTPTPTTKTGTLQALGSYGDTTKHIAALVGTCNDSKWVHVLIDCQAMIPLGDLWARDSSAHGLYLRRALGCSEENPGIGDTPATLYYAASLVLALGQLHVFNICTEVSALNVSFSQTLVHFNLPDSNSVSTCQVEPTRCVVTRNTCHQNRLRVAVTARPPIGGL